MKVRCIKMQNLDKADTLGKMVKSTMVTGTMIGKVDLECLNILMVKSTRVSIWKAGDMVLGR